MRVVDAMRETNWCINCVVMRVVDAVRETNWCINCVVMRVVDAMKETIADVSSASPSVRTNDSQST